MNKYQNGASPKRIINKLLLSAFVFFSFIAYSLNKPADNSNSGISSVPPTPNSFTTPIEATPTEPSSSALAGSADSQQSLPAIRPSPVLETATLAVVETSPTSTPVPALPTKAAPKLAGQYKDGSYVGPEVNAFYGLLKVKVVIQNGRIVDVQFLEYPQDRRTSVRINSYAVPYLQQEAIQAQNANVNNVTGATLTSEAFVRSFQSALTQAKN